MTDFKYDDYEEDEVADSPPPKPDEEDDSMMEERERERRAKKNKEFEENYKLLMMKEQQPPVQRDDKNVTPPPMKKQSKKEGKKEEPKKPPLAPPPAPENSKAKLIDQHIKLKSQLKELAVKMDEILVKERQRRKKKNNPNAAEEDERVKEIRAELKEQEAEIAKNKATIQQLRKNLDNKYDINKIVEKEDELKLLKRQLEALEKEKASLEKIRGLQDKAIRTSEDEETKKKYERMKSDLAELTQRNRKYVESINEKEKQLRRLHQNYIVKEEKIKEIEAKLKEKDKKGGASSDDINEYTISQLEQSIKELQRERQQVEKEGNDKLRQMERQKKELRLEVEKKKIILEEKEKDLRLNQIKYRDIVRLINSCAAETKKESSSLTYVEENKDETDSKTSGKRMVEKKGRLPPTMIAVKEDEPAKKDDHLVDKIDYKEKHQVGVGDNLDDYDEYAEDFQADDDIVSAEKKEQSKASSKQPSRAEESQPKNNAFIKPNLSRKG